MDYIKFVESHTTKTTAISYKIYGVNYNSIEQVIKLMPNNTNEQWFEYFKLFLKEWPPEYKDLIPHFTKNTLLEMINQVLNK